MTDDQKSIVQRLYREGFNQMRLEILDEIVAEDFEDHGALPGQGPGREGLKQRVEMMRAGFPDQVLVIQDIVAEGDLVAIRVISRGTHRGSMMGFPPTGRAFEIEGMDFYRVQDGQVAEHWAQYDVPALMRQLGADA
jgi:steroid delta-isomerase-like uncharacterized protein